MKRRSFVGAMALAAFAASTPAWARTQRRVGVLLGTEEESEGLLEDLARALAAKGWPPSSIHFVVERSASAAANDAAAAKLVRAGVDVLVSFGTPRVASLARATSTVPIVGNLANPVATGLAASLARPGRNVTGLAYGGFDEAEVKPLQLLKSLVPGLGRLLHFLPASYDVPRALISATASAAARVGLAYEDRAVKDLGDFRAGFESLRGRPRGAAYLAIFGNVEVSRPIAAMALELRVPTLWLGPEGVAAGGLLSYAVEPGDRAARMAGLVDRLLRGGDAATTPFELPTAFRLRVNRATARALGLEIPQEILLRADEVVG